MISDLSRNLHVKSKLCLFYIVSRLLQFVRAHITALATVEFSSVEFRSVQLATHVKREEAEAAGEERQSGASAQHSDGHRTVLSNQQ